MSASNGSKRGMRTQPMELKQNEIEASVKGPDEFFTGNVRIDPLFEAAEPARMQGASVTFEPGAGSAWHRHPLGQTLIVTCCGWYKASGNRKLK